MALVLGRYWSWITPTYLTMDMTMAEISDALQFVNRFEELKTPEYKGKKTIAAWVGVVDFRDNMRQVANKLRREM